MQRLLLALAIVGGAFGIGIGNAGVSAAQSEDKCELLTWRVAPRDKAGTAENDAMPGTSPQHDNEAPVALAPPPEVWAGLPGVDIKIVNDSSYWKCTPPDGV